MASRRRVLQMALFILALILIGTVVVLSSISIYLSIDKAAYITEQEVGLPEDDYKWNATAIGKVERIPRIIHQTWKTEALPDRWKNISQACRDMMPDYDYKLWTDADAREFIAKEYDWFLDTFDSYKYPIQRADAIRYFVLYHYGGVYMDLDIGCRRRLDPLLVYPVVLPKTIPVGVSNDLMFSEKEHPFLAQTIYNLIAFDHDWVLNYPTVMFSTGPMFLSAQYGMWTSSHLPTPELPGGEIRILPKDLYGKNIAPEQAPRAFFSHYYGSSWHADDAAFIGFLGKWGKGLLWVGFCILVVGMINLAWRRGNRKTDAGYVLLPRTYIRNGRRHINLGFFTFPIQSGVSPSGYSSPDIDEAGMPMLPLSFEVRSASPTNSENSTERRSGIASIFYRFSSQLVTFIANGRERARGRASRRGWQGRGYLLFFLPAIFAPTTVAASDLGSRRPSLAHAQSSPCADARPPYPDKMGQMTDFEDRSNYGTSTSLQASGGDGSNQGFQRPLSPNSNPRITRPDDAPPPYPAGMGDANAPARRMRNPEDDWDL